MLAVLLAPESHAARFVLATRRNASVSKSYEFQALWTAVRHAPGAHELDIVKVDEPQATTMDRLAAGDAPFNVFIAGFSAEREARFAQVDFPISRGLLGYRLLIIPPDRQSLFNGIDSLEALQRQARIASGTGWPDTRILKANGIKVEEGDYMALWDRVRAGAADGYGRGANEVMPEINGGPGDGLALEESLTIVYRLPQFAYMAKQDQELADLLMQGFEGAFSQGTLEARFYRHDRNAKALDLLKGRRVIRLTNPALTDRVKAIPDMYWVSPTEEN
ncbi:hypothetical protein [Yunchengibacter salinarum]|uniref:hypothetical protein n=1 Tax=Yunchengibacter salinarum TaxID=3133399 RepID=UPI0035B617F9